MEADPKDARAVQTRRAMQGFYCHLAVFCAGIAILAVINARAGGVWWVQWPFLGWGFGLAAHGALVFGPQNAFAAEWEETTIQDVAARDARSRR